MAKNKETTKEPTRLSVGLSELLVSTDNDIANDFRKIHLLYLEKLEKLTDRERECITNYLYFVNKPFVVKAG